MPQALVCPAVGRVGQEVAELAYGAPVVAQGGAHAAVHGPQICRPLVDVLRRPLPRHRIGVPGEGPDRAFLITDVSHQQVPGELLVAPAFDQSARPAATTAARPPSSAEQPLEQGRLHPSAITLRLSHLTQEFRITRPGDVFAVQSLDGVRLAGVRRGDGYRGSEVSVPGETTSKRS